MRVCLLLLALAVGLIGPDVGQGQPASAADLQEREGEARRGDRAQENEGHHDERVR